MIEDEKVGKLPHQLPNHLTDSKSSLHYAILVVNTWRFIGLLTKLEAQVYILEEYVLY